MFVGMSKESECEGLVVSTHIEVMKCWKCLMARSIANNTRLKVLYLIWADLSQEVGDGAPGVT